MHSTKQIIFRAIVLLVVVMIVHCSARPAGSSEEEITHGSRRLPAHTRSQFHKRHAEISLLSAIGRRMQNMRRLAKLNNLMSTLDTSRTYSVKVYPSVPAHKEINPDLLQQLNGRHLPGGVKMRIIQNEQPNTPPVGLQYQRYIQQAQNDVALATTCRDMQEMIVRNNLRLRIRCQPAAASLSLPAAPLPLGSE